MRNIAYLIKSSGMGFNEIMNLPYSVFLSLLKHFRLMEIEQTEEGRKMIAKSKILDQTEPDWNRIRKIKNYRKIGDADESHKNIQK